LNSDDSEYNQSGSSNGEEEPSISQSVSFQEKSSKKRKQKKKSSSKNSSLITLDSSVDINRVSYVPETPFGSQTQEDDPPIETNPELIQTGGIINEKIAIPSFDGLLQKASDVFLFLIFSFFIFKGIEKDL
jgi:hypothetical protein